MAVDLGSAVGYLDLDTSRFTSGIQSALSELSVFTSQTASFNDKLSAVGKTLTKTGTTLTKGLTVPLAGAGAAFVKITSDFDTAMSEVGAISESTSDDLQRLRDKAKEMGAITKFSATEAANAFMYMAQAGWDTNQMIDGISGVMNLAAASGEELALTSDILTDALTAFGLQASDAAHFADLLAVASAATNTDVAMMGESFKYVAPVAGALGFTAEDTAEAIGLMANSGIKASQAGTALRQLFTNLTSDVEIAGDAFGKWHISVTNADGSMRELNEILDDIREPWQLLTEAEKAATAEMLSGKVGMSGTLAILNSTGDSVSSLREQIENCDGAAETMAVTMQDNLQGDVEQLGGAFETLAISFGEIMIPKIRELVAELTEVVETLGTMDQAQLSQIINIAGVVAAIGPLMIIIGKLISGISSMITLGQGVAAFFAEGAAGATALNGALTLITGPVGIVIAAVASLAVGFKHLYDTNEEIAAAINKAWSGIKETFSSVATRIGEALSGLGGSTVNLWNTISPVVDMILQAIMVTMPLILSQVVGTFNGIINAIGPLIDALTDVVDFVSNVFSGIGALITGDMDGAVESFKAAGQNILDFVEHLWETLKEFFSGFAEGIIGALQTSWDLMGSKMQDMVTTLVNNVITWFKELPTNLENIWNSIVQSVSEWATNMGQAAGETKTKVVDTVSTFFQELPYNIGVALGTAVSKVVNWTKETYNTVKSEVPKIINSVTTFFQELPGKIWTHLKNTWQKTVDFTVDTAETINEEVPKIIDSAVNFFKELPGKIWESLTEVVNNVVKWGASMTTAAIKVAGDTIESIVTTFKELPSKLVEIGQQAITGLVDGVTSKIQDAIDAVRNVASGIVSGFKDALDIHSPSKVFYALGGYINEGLANGMFDSSGLPTKAMDSIADQIIGSGDAISTGLIQINSETGSVIYDNTYRWINKNIDLFEKEKDKRIKNLNKGTDASLKAIEREISATQDAYDIKIKLMEQEYKAKIAYIDEETAAQVEALNAEIDAITAEQEKQSREEEEQEYQEELREKQAALDALLSAEELNATDIAAAQQAIDDLVAERKKQLLKQEQDDRKEALRNEISAVQDAATKNKESIQSEYEAKKWQLEQQKADELAYLAEMQEALKKDYEDRTELDEVQTKLKSANQDKLTKKEIQELKTRETELKASIANNTTTLEKFGVDVEAFGVQYGRDLLSGFKGVEDELEEYFQNIIDRANEAREAARDAAMVGGAEGYGGITDITDYSAYSNEPQAEGLFRTARSLGLSTVGSTISGMLGIDYERLAKAIASSVKPSVTMQNTFTSPESLSEQDIRRDQELMLRELAFEYGI